MSSAPSGNLFADIAGRLDAEEIASLLTTSELRIERIVSTGQSSPPGHWYDQDWAEWVIVLRGSARLRFADEREPRLLGAGDYLLIPPHRRHRVEWTTPEEATLWLAIHFRQSSGPIRGLE